MTDKWTTADIPDQSGRTAVVTGANSGLGLQTSIALAKAGATVVMACRNADKAAKAKDTVLAAAPGADVTLQTLDLASLASVREAADALNERLECLDILVNNAGVMAIPRRETADGFEMQFGTNHLGHFALTGLLLDTVLATEGSRIVSVSSNAHKPGKIDFDDLGGTRTYSKWSRYAQSKIANLYFIYELARRLDASGSSTIAAAAHPGYAATNLQAVGPEMEGKRIQRSLSELLNKIIAQSDEMGALPQLYAATAPEVPNGAYVGPDRLFEQRGHPKLTRSNARSHDEDVARRLWDVSEVMTGVTFGAVDPAA